MNLTAAIRVPVLVLLAAALAGPAALGADARRRHASRGPALSLTVGLDGGKGDEDFGGNLFQPFVTLGSYAAGLDWEARVRGLFTDQDDGVKSTGVEGRALVGWGWQQPRSYNASLFAGGSFRTLRVETDQDQASDFGPDKYDCRIAVAEFGARFSMPGAGGAELVAEIAGGPLVFFEDDQDSAVEGGMPGSGSYAFEAYLGFTWAVPELGASVSLGGAYEQLKVERDDGVTVDLEKKLLRVSITWSF